MADFARCIFLNYALRSTGLYSVTTGWTLLSEPKKLMSILEIPDIITLYSPTNLMDYNRRELSLLILRNTERRTALESAVSLDLMGNFSKTGTSIYMKMN